MLATHGAGQQHDLRGLLRLFGTALLAANAVGCAAVGSRKSMPESLAACRKLSRDGIAALERGESDRASELLRKAVKKSPTDVDARRQLADVLWQTGAYDDAVRHMEAAAELDPENATTIVRAGEMLLAIGQFDQARNNAEIAIALDPQSARAWALRGRVSRRQSEPRRALADLQQSLHYDPEASEVLLETAELQYQLGRPERSLTTLHFLLDRYRPGEEPRRALWLEGLVYRAVDRPVDAVESLYAAAKRGAAEPNLLYQLAQAQRRVGDDQAAVASVQQALAVDAGHEASRILLTQLQANPAAPAAAVIRR
ncbi:MAG: tetratricopeptide repeat protein [Planctomycetota bacterium]